MTGARESHSAKPSGRNPGIDDGSRIAVIGGGPAGSFFSYFILQMAARVGIRVRVDIYERRDFATFGPSGCNMCGGVINESLVQSLSIEGIDLPSEIVQRGIDSLYFHSDKDTVGLHAPFGQMRIATVYRGAGPKGANGLRWKSFDGYLLGLACDRGANVVRESVTDLALEGDKPCVIAGGTKSEPYDLLAGAIGVNTPSLEAFEKLGFGYKRPSTRKTSNLEYKLGSQYIASSLGNSMHAFLLDLPKLEFAAIIPKGDYVTLCLIGDRINNEFVEDFVNNPVVSSYLSDAGGRPAACRCAPLASLGNAVKPYGNRIILLGDAAMARLNKDGIGSSYRLAKAAAATALFSGVSEADFRRGYSPICRSIAADNKYGRVIFGVVDFIKKSPLLTRAVMRMARNEQGKAGSRRRMSMVLWDMFTGSSPYREVFYRSLDPAFWGALVGNIGASIFHKTSTNENTVRPAQEATMDSGSLGKDYHAGDFIVREGDIGDYMYVILSGQAEIMRSAEGTDIRLGVLGKGDIVGEMALFQRESRSVTVRALTDMRVMTVDRKLFLKRVHEDPSFVFAILQKMSQRVRDLNAELAQMKSVQ